jgi:hypothetical protein
MKITIDLPKATFESVLKNIIEIYSSIPPKGRESTGYLKNEKGETIGDFQITG